MYFRLYVTFGVLRCSDLLVYSFPIAHVVFTNMYLNQFYFYWFVRFWPEKPVSSKMFLKKPGLPESNYLQSLDVQ